MDEAPFRILYVGSGNQCRSPLAERLTAALSDGLHVEVTSAGTLGLRGHRCPPEMIRAAAANGVDLLEHRSRALGDVDAETADLVIGFELGHVAVATLEGRADPHRTFGLVELSDLLEEGPVPAGGPAERVAALDALREPGYQVGHIVDPIGGPPQAYEEAAGQISKLVRAAIPELLPKPES